MRKILDAVETVRRDRNFTVVFSAQALVAADTALDLTNEVLARMRTGGEAARKPD